MHSSGIARSGWAAMALIVATLTACDRSDDRARPSRAFCEAAYEYDDQVARLGPERVDEQIELVEPIAAHAPADVKADAEVFLDALRRVGDGDDSVVDDPDIEAAYERLHRRAIDGCGLFDQEPPGGL